MFKIILLILGILISLSSFASENGVPPPIEKEKTELVSDNSLQKSDFEEDAKLYKLLYENSKNANDSLVAVIYSTLAIVIAFLIALFSAQIFFNLKLNKEEVASIRNELDKKLADSKAELNNGISNLFKENSKDSRSEFNLFKKQISDNLNDRLSSENKSLELALKNKSNEIESVETSLKHDIDMLEIDLEKSIGDIWGLRGVNGNALTRYINSASLKLKRGHELKYILTDIVQLLDATVDLHEADQDKLQTLINNLPEKFESHKDAIVLKLNTVRVYKFVDDPLNTGKRIEKTIRAATA